MATWATLLLAIVFTAVPSVLRADEPVPSRSPSIAVGTRTWVATGYSTLGISSRGVNPLSELTWRGVDSIVQEVNAEVAWKRLRLLGSIGGGAIDQGVLVDDDFNRSNHAGRLSHTRSDVGGDALFYMNTDVGWQLVNWGREARPGYVDALAGMQYWLERYVGFGATGFPAAAPSGTRAITVDYNWVSLRLGARAEVPLLDSLALRAQALVLPWSAFAGDDVHHLRTDLKQHPSFREEARGGFGAQIEAGLTYAFRTQWSVEAGYRYWRIDSGPGLDTARGVTGDSHARLNGAATERYGPFLGVQYRF